MLTALSEKDIDAVQDLYARCTDYFLLQDGVEPDRAEAADLFRDVPPGKTPEDLAVFGLAGDRGLDAVGALLRDYPLEGQFYLPFLVVAADQRSRGLERVFYTALYKWAVDHGAREIQLVVLEDNPSAERFWHARGFDEVRRVGPHTFKQRSHRRIELRHLVSTTLG